MWTPRWTASFSLTALLAYLWLFFHSLFRELTWLLLPKSQEWAAPLPRSPTPPADGPLCSPRAGQKPPLVPPAPLTGKYHCNGQGGSLRRSFASAGTVDTHSSTWPPMDQVHSFTKMSQSCGVNYHISLSSLKTGAFNQRLKASFLFSHCSARPRLSKRKCTISTISEKTYLPQEQV